mgnify:CR=1 FL=1
MTGYIEEGKSMGKAVIFDLDGTLLNSDALLNEDVPERLNRLIDKGLCFTVATARTYATVNSIVKDVHLTYPMILMNGVMLYDPVSKSCINAEIIERDSVEYILKGRKKFGVTGFAYALSPEISEETLESEIASNLEKNLKSGVASNLKKNSNTGEENQIQKSGRKMATYYEKIATEHMEKFYVERRDVYHKPFSKVEKLEDILEKIDGAGDVKVMITYQDSGTQVVEKDKNTSENSLEESDSTGGVRSTKEQQLQESTVYEDADAGNTPFVSKELLPKVEGILIVASGGDNQKVKQNISEAVLALFQVEAHRIKIVKMSGLEDSK